MKTLSLAIAAVCLSAASISIAARTNAGPALSPTPAPAKAAAAQASPITDSIKRGHDIIKGYITKSAELMPEADYAFKPAGTAAIVRTYGQILGHVANANYLFCGAAMGASTAGGERGPGGADYEKLAKKAEIQKALADSFAYCDKAFASVSDQNGGQTVPGLPIGPTTKIGALAFNVSHDFEHYGNLVTYLRAKGLVPPSSKQ
jgi:uncharacterized damage-inducible protein DinB